MEAHETYKSTVEEIGSSLEAKAETPEDEGDGDGDGDEEGAEVVAEAEAITQEAVEETEKVAELELVTASAETEQSEKPEPEPQKPRLRRAPAPAAERIMVQEEKPLSFVASGLLPTTPPGTKLTDKAMLASAMQEMARALGAPVHEKSGREVKHRVARLDFSGNFPEERTLEMRQARDETLDVPTLILPSIQVNIRAGRLPPADDNGVAYLRIPLNALPAR